MLQYDGSYYFFSRGFWPLTTGKDSATKIAIVNGSMTKKNYQFKELAQSKLEYYIQVFSLLFFVLSGIYNVQLFKKRLKKLFFNRKPNFYLFYTGNANEKELKKQFPFATVSNNWQQILNDIAKTQKNKNLNVGFYPHSSLQLSLEKQ